MGLLTMIDLAITMIDLAKYLKNSKYVETQGQRGW